MSLGGVARTPVRAIGQLFHQDPLAGLHVDEDVLAGNREPVGLVAPEAQPEDLLKSGLPITALAGPDFHRLVFFDVRDTYKSKPLFNRKWRENRKEQNDREKRTKPQWASISEKRSHVEG